MDFYRHLLAKTGVGAPVTFSLVYLISVVFTFQTLVTAYSSSTYLKAFIRPEFVGLLFAIGAGGAIVISLLLPKLLGKLGNVFLTLHLMLIISFSLLVIGYAPTPEITIISFVILMMVSPQVYLNIDVFLETLIGEEEKGTGSKRGLILTIMSAAAFFSPLAMGFIVGPEENLSNVYYVGAGVGLIFIAILLFRFRQFYDPIYKVIAIKDMLKSASKNRDVRTVLSSQFLLQLFYTWAIIYIPLYLATEANLPWTDISQILATGLLAFVLFEYPIGIMADKHWGEKEMMAVGFLILALATASISIIPVLSVIGWMILMFLSRLGASLVEVTTESHFFKHVKAEDSALIGLFRLMRPLANLLGAMLGSLSLLFLPFNLIFIVLSFIMVSGIFITSFLTDTR